MEDKLSFLSFRYIRAGIESILILSQRIIATTVFSASVQSEDYPLER
jgi:hypothetical protein